MSGLKIFRLFTVIVCGLCCTYSCSFKKQGASKKAEFVKDIPKDREGDYYGPYQYVKEMAPRLDLDSMDVKVDSFAIRIWMGYAFEDTTHLFTLNFTDGEWKASFREYTIEFDYGEYTRDSGYARDIPIVTASFIKGKIKEWPKRINWRLLIDSLHYFGIVSLPDMDDIPGIKELVFMDSDWVTVEVATSQQYRIYSYVKPCALMDRFWQAGKLERIICMLEREFEFKRLRGCVMEKIDVRMEEDKEFDLEPIPEP